MVFLGKTKKIDQKKKKKTQKNRPSLQKPALGDFCGLTVPYTVIPERIPCQNSLPELKEEAR